MYQTQQAYLRRLIDDLGGPEGLAKETISAFRAADANVQLNFLHQISLMVPLLDMPNQSAAPPVPGFNPNSVFMGQ